jgi:hypothetical protein
MKMRSNHGTASIWVPVVKKQLAIISGVQPKFVGRQDRRPVTWPIGVAHGPEADTHTEKYVALAPEPNQAAAQLERLERRGSTGGGTAQQHHGVGYT